MPILVVLAACAESTDGSLPPDAGPPFDGESTASREAGAPPVDAGLADATPSDASPTAPPCVAVDPPSLTACVSRLRSGAARELQIAARIECTQPGECAINLDGLDGVTIRGTVPQAGVHRGAAQSVYTVVSASNAKNLTLQGLTFDDDAATPACAPLSECTHSALAFSASQNVVLDQVAVLHGKANTTISVGGVDGFTFRRSRVVNATAIGLWIGSRDRPCKNLHVVDSEFSDNRSNAILLDGVTGATAGDNSIERTVFTHNHRDAVYTVCSGPCPGGQLDLVFGDHYTVSDNTFRDGYLHGYPGLFAAGIEMDGGRSVLIANNRVFNNSGGGIYLNPGQTVTDATLSGNVFVTNGSAKPIDVPGATLSGNTALGTNILRTFESTADMDGWLTWHNCATDAQYGAGWNSDASALEGQGQLRLRTTGFQGSCANPGMYALSPRVPVQPGTTVYVTQWSRNGGGSGLTTLIMVDASGNSLAEASVAWAPGSTWSWHGNDLLRLTAPAGTVAFQVRQGLTTPSAVADVDMLRVSF